MTVRNGQPYLQEAAGSILNQTYTHFRFLILDNASTDESREIIRAFHDHRIDLVELPEDIGQTAALNRGLQMVDTPWVARMDADDVSLPQRLAFQMVYLERHPELVLMGTGARIINGKGEILRDRNVPVTDVDLRWLHYMGTSGLNHSSVVFSTEALAQAGGYPIQYRYAQDYALWCRLLDLGQTANIPQPLVYIRYHGSNTTDFDRAEQEIRAILRQQLSRLFPGEGEVPLAGVAAALRGLSSDSSLTPSPIMIRCLSALPERFGSVYGGHPSRFLLRQYSYHWLSLARKASSISPGNALAWIKLASQTEPALFVNPRLWYTLAWLALNPLRWRSVPS